MRLEESLKERSPRAGAREARAGRCLCIRIAVRPRQHHYLLLLRLSLGGSGEGIFHSLRNVLDIATPPPSPLPPPPTPLHHLLRLSLGGSGEGIDAFIASAMEQGERDDMVGPRDARSDG